MQQKQYSFGFQRGMSVAGVVVILVVVGFFAMIALKVVPAYAEYRTIQDAIVKAKASGDGVREIQSAFDKNAEINNIEAISGRDLMITRDTGATEVSFAYEKRVPLVANVSLVIEYAGTTDPTGEVAAAAAADAGAQ